VPVIWRPGQSGRQGLLITGTAGGGKTSTAHSLVAQAGLNGELIVVLDGKSEGEFDWAARFAALPSTRAGMFAAIGFVYAEMRRRQAAVKALGYGGRLHEMPTDLATEHGLAKRLMLFAEEMTTLVTFLRADPATAALTDPKEAKAAAARAEGEWRLAMGQLAEVARLGRSARISVVASVQHAIADNLGPNQFGSTIMSVLNARIGVGRLEREILQRLFPSSTPAAR
ncbi:MAG: type IV secretion system DNA-binding domain-containing protein, partial [Actinomycetia bacterium]|nr:type IV secretion system DNA-binding domain-containing protein [Actinomycetes bacterium]